ncbi:hypothetical protein KIPB_004170, partial [Kipferlia bialata]|eukprot:g4170.t1
MILLLSALLLFGALCAVPASASLCYGIDERDALEAIYIATGGPYWLQGPGWLNYPDYCTWEGVGCDGVGHVISLSMASFGMTGQLPEEIGCLPYLQTLIMTDNNMLTTFPYGMCNLPMLSTINLNGANVIGALPECVCDMPSLQTLLLNRNYLESALPTCLGSNPTLDTFTAECAYVEGTLPEGLYNGNVADVQVRCNFGLLCPNPNAVSPNTTLLCGTDDCDESCSVIDPLQCAPVIEITGCGPYFLEGTPCNFFGVSGHVQKEGTGQDLPGVAVCAYPPASVDFLACTTTNLDGEYLLDLTSFAGDYTELRIEFSHPAFITKDVEIEVPVCGLLTVDVDLVINPDE